MFSSGASRGRDDLSFCMRSHSDGLAVPVNAQNQLCLQRARLFSTADDAQSFCMQQMSHRLQLFRLSRKARLEAIQESSRANPSAQRGGRIRRMLQLRALAARPSRVDAAV